MRTIAFTLVEEDAALLTTACRIRRESFAAFARRAVLRELGRIGFLTEEETAAILREVPPS